MHRVPLTVTYVVVTQLIVHLIGLSSMPQISVHIDGVAQLLYNIKVNKASGPDNLSAHFLQETA